VAFLKDKDFVSMLRQIQGIGKIYLSEVSYKPRALVTEKALPVLERENIEVFPVGGAEKAIEAAKTVKEDVAVFAGSIYFVGEVMSKILSGGFGNEALQLR
jgi:folylpolyglutamate synthase/dihydropteroate synthase